MTTHRLNLLFNEQDMQLLAQAQQQTQAVSKTETFRRALKLLVKVTSPTVHKVTVESQDGRVESVVLL